MVRRAKRNIGIWSNVLPGESPTVTLIKLEQSYGNHSSSQAQVFRWDKIFLEGGENVEYEQRLGGPSTST